jgi:hypothetical protein
MPRLIQKNTENEESFAVISPFLCLRGKLFSANGQHKAMHHVSGRERVLPRSTACTHQNLKLVAVASIARFCRSLECGMAPCTLRAAGNLT